MLASDYVQLAMKLKKKLEDMKVLDSQTLLGGLGFLSGLVQLVYSDTDWGDSWPAAASIALPRAVATYGKATFY